MGRGVSDMIQFGVGIEAHCEREHDMKSPDLAWGGYVWAPCWAQHV